MVKTVNPPRHSSQFIDNNLEKKVAGQPPDLNAKCVSLFYESNVFVLASNMLKKELIFFLVSVFIYYIYFLLF